MNNDCRCVCHRDSYEGMGRCECVADADPTARQPIGAAFVLGPDSTESDAIDEFRRIAERDGFDWQDGTEQAQQAPPFETREDKVLEAVDVRGFLAPTVYKYREGTEVTITGVRWAVTANPVPLHPKLVVEPIDVGPLETQRREEAP